MCQIGAHFTAASTPPHHGRPGCGAHALCKTIMAATVVVGLVVVVVVVVVAVEVVVVVVAVEVEVGQY